MRKAQEVMQNLQDGYDVHSKWLRLGQELSNPRWVFTMCGGAVEDGILRIHARSTIKAFEDVDPIAFQFSRGGFTFCDGEVQYTGMYRESQVAEALNIIEAWLDS